MPSRLFSPDEYQILAEAGIPSPAVSKYSHRHLIPQRPRQQQIIALLGRDPWNGAVATSAGRPKGLQPAPVAAPATVNQSGANCQTSVSNCQIDISPCPRMKDIPDDPVTEAERKSMPINAPALLSAILKRGIKDCFLPACRDKNGRDSNKPTREAALAWLRDTARDGVTSFIGICDALEIDSDRARKRVLLGKINFDDKDTA